MPVYALCLPKDVLLLYHLLLSCFRSVSSRFVCMYTQSMLRHAHATLQSQLGMCMLPHAVKQERENSSLTEKKHIIIPRQCRTLRLSSLFVLIIYLSLSLISLSLISLSLISLCGLR